MPLEKQRTQSISKFNVSQGPSTEHDKKPDKVRVIADASKAKFSSGHDPLMQSLSQGIPELPNRYHLGHTHPKVHAKGINYNPAGEFGRIVGKTAKGTHYTPHTSPPGKNAVGNNSNRKGENANGNYSGKRGSNPLGHAMNRVGTNAVGSNSNRTGQKSGYPGFRPHGGGKNV